MEKIQTKLRTKSKVKFTGKRKVVKKAQKEGNSNLTPLSMTSFGIKGEKKECISRNFGNSASLAVKTLEFNNR